MLAPVWTSRHDSRTGCAIGLSLSAHHFARLVFTLDLSVLPQDYEQSKVLDTQRMKQCGTTTPSMQWQDYPNTGVLGHEPESSTRRGNLSWFERVVLVDSGL